MSVHTHSHKHTTLCSSWGALHTLPWLIKGHDYCHAGRQCRVSHMKQIHCSTPLFLLHTAPAVVTGTVINTNQFRYYLFLSKENILSSAEILVEDWQMLYNLLSLGPKKPCNSTFEWVANARYILQKVHMLTGTHHINRVQDILFSHCQCRTYNSEFSFVFALSWPPGTSLFREVHPYCPVVLRVRSIWYVSQYQTDVAPAKKD